MPLHFTNPQKTDIRRTTTTTELLRNCLQYPVQRSTTTGRLPHSTRTAALSTFSYDSHITFDINIKSWKKLANTRIPEEAGDSEHATVYNTDTMESTDKARTTKTVHRTQNKSDPRLIIKKHAGMVNHNLLQHKKRRKRGHYKAKTSRKYLQVPWSYLQVPTGRSNEAPSGTIHLLTPKPHTRSTKGSGARHYQLHGASEQSDKGAEWHDNTEEGRNGDIIATAAPSWESLTRPTKETCTHIACIARPLRRC